MFLNSSVCGGLVFQQISSICILSFLAVSCINNATSFYESGHISWRQPGDVNGRSAPGSHILSDEDDIFSRMGTSKISRKYHMGLSSSDAEIDYRRGRSLRQGKGDFAWRDWVIKAEEIELFRVCVKLAGFLIHISFGFLFRLSNLGSVSRVTWFFLIDVLHFYLLYLSQYLSNSITSR